MLTLFEVKLKILLYSNLISPLTIDHRTSYCPSTTDNVITLFSISVLSSASVFTGVLSKLTFKYEIILICFSNSSCQEKTARTAPSIAFPATEASTLIRLCTRPWHPLTARAPPPHLRLSLCQAYRPRTPQQTEPSRESRTPLRSGPSPGACMKVGVSIYIFGGGWMRAAWGSWLNGDTWCV